MGCHKGMDTKELFFPRTFMRAPSSAPKTPAMDEQIHCGWMFTPSSMFPGGSTPKSALKASTADFWSLTEAAKKESWGSAAGWPVPEQTKHVTFEDEPDNGGCVPMDISGE
jgi:hypothetical protein